MTVGRKRSPYRYGKAARGQGLLEYVLVVSVVLAITVTAMQTIASSTAAAVNSMVNNIQTVTNVSN